jgi:hypothetical protein
MDWLSDQPDLTAKERPEIGLSSADTVIRRSLGSDRLTMLPRFNTFDFSNLIEHTAVG